jgi:hypothetical protein
MKRIELNVTDAVLVRQLDIRGKNGAPNQVGHILIGKPAQIDSDEWLCAYRIIGVDGLQDETHQVFGIDGVQALENAVEVTDGLLTGSDSFKQGRLFCNGRIHPLRKWLAMVEYGCEVADQLSESIDIQVKYYEHETEENVRKAIINEQPQAYLNGDGNKVIWSFRRILMIRENPSYHQGAELIGYITGA